jgi:hypothetical protein
LTFYRGSPSRKSASSESIGKAILFASQARRDIRPILFACVGQLEARENTEQRNDFCRSIIMRKIEATIIALEKSIPRSDKWGAGDEVGVCRFVPSRRKSPGDYFRIARTGGQLRGVIYFRSWVGMPIKWRGISRRPIPDNWHWTNPLRGSWLTRQA